MSDEKNITGASKEEKKTDGNYFGKREEDAISEYLACSNPIERQRIFNSILKPAFTKMIESLIRRYNLFTIDEPFEDTFNDTLGFLMLKINNFDASKGYKAYSYCGTVCKNYLIRKRKESQKNESLNMSFNPTYGNGLTDEDESNEKVDEKNRFNKKVIEKISDAIRRSVDNREEQNLTDEEYKVGIALLELLKNWENILDSPDMDSSRKYNKTAVMYYLTESTLLSTKEVRDAMKRYKLLYMIVKEDYVRNIYKNKED
ncbi:MAG: hypothetical protein J6X18_10860 [Bacteroidales bacterium]|nr:hypothetical protein [Bacteroidales bacterium]